MQFGGKKLARLLLALADDTFTLSNVEKIMIVARCHVHIVSHLPEIGFYGFVYIHCVHPMHGCCLVILAVLLRRRRRKMD